jgi:hypothetical protein
LFGLEALVESNYPLTAVTLHECEICAVGRDELLTFLQGNPDIALGMIRFLVSEMTRVRTQIVDLGGTELYSSAALPFELVSVMIVSGAYLEQHGTRVAGLCSAWRRGEEDLRTSAGAREWVAARMKVSPDALTSMLNVVRVVNPSESDTLLGPPRPRLLATTAHIQAVLLESGLLTQSIPLQPIFRWPAGVDQGACRG